MDSATVEVRLRPHQPLGVLVLALAWSALLGWAAVAAGTAGIFVLPFLLLFLALVPDSARALLRRPRLRYDATGVEMRGWQTDARLDWDDLIDIELVAPDPRRPQVRLRGRPGAPSWRVTRRRLVLRLEPHVEGEVIDVPLLALDEPGALVSHLQAVQRESPGLRQRWFDADAVAFLTGRAHPLG